MRAKPVTCDSDSWGGGGPEQCGPEKASTRRCRTETTPHPPTLPLPACPHLGPLGLAPPCSLGRSENL